MTEWAPGILVMLGALTVGAAATVPLEGIAGAREIAWADVAPAVQRLLSQGGLDGETFPTRISQLRQQNQARIREGDLDHLVYYVLQSSSFTDLPPIEPATSAKTFMEKGTIPADARARLQAFAAAAVDSGAETRLGYFQRVLSKERPDGVASGSFLAEQYTRAMGFLYKQEFIAARGLDRAAEVGRLYQMRGLSTDTSVEAGYVVHLGLATLRELEPQRRIRRVLIVGPGLDSAPRTGLLETGAPESHQPFAVMDSLLALRLAEPNDLQVTAADINVRVIDWFQAIRGRRIRLTLGSTVGKGKGVRLTEDFSRYFEALGRAVGVEAPSRSGHLVKSIQVDPRAAAAVDATTLDIVVDRLEAKYDLIVVTNVFPYLRDTDLVLALTNISLMLAPGGLLLHNEARPIVAEATFALRLALLHSRSAVIATVEGAESPLYDAIWMHRALD
jgi:Nodulation protein S (NodS)